MPSTAKTSDEDRWQRALQHSHRRHEQAQSGQPQRLRHRLRDSSRGSGIGKDLAASHSQPRSIGDLPANAPERPSLAVSNARSARARTAADMDGYFGRH
jgi:hypothetical protein